jgi:hypothetical protein
MEKGRMKEERNTGRKGEDKNGEIETEMKNERQEN